MYKHTSIYIIIIEVREELHWKKCSTKNMLIALKTDKYLLEISSMHLTQVQYDLDIDYITLVLRRAYFFKDKRTFFKTV